MILESLLAYAHFIAILSLVVFLTSEAALCRSEYRRSLSLVCVVIIVLLINHQSQVAANTRECT